MTPTEEGIPQVVSSGGASALKDVQMKDVFEADEEEKEEGGTDKKEEEMAAEDVEVEADAAYQEALNNFRQSTEDDEAESDEE